jgi:type VI secretion system secreted protein VgrG
MKDLFTITSSALPDTTRVAGFRGTEGISRLYDFAIYLLGGAEGQDLDLADAIGAQATLTIDRDDGRGPFVFHGIFAAFELLHEVDDRSMFRAELVPQLWHLTKTFHSRIFTDQSIPDILKEVLEESGLGRHDYVLRLAGDYAPQSHVCQYRESNLDFISRWMEREGMYYYFEQGDSAERLVITDSRSFQGKLDEKPVRFFALGGHDGSAGEALHTFTCKHHALPASLRLKDYDYGKPTLDVSGSAPVTKTGLGEINVYGARFFTPEEGEHLAAVRAEELLTQQVVYRGSGTALYLRAGYFFTLEDHPRAAFDMEYLVTFAEHCGNQAISSPEMHALTGIASDRPYGVEVTAIPAKVQFRAESKTAWPRIYGYENGTICGPVESEYAQIDEDGRYNVKFKFDESDLKNGKASTWVRMLQPHGGGIEGWHFPLRKGTEVVFTFLGGDPDRPVIAGVVPNAHTPSPVVRANHTTNVIQTGGRNRLELEDKAGHQRITLQTPYANTRLRMGAPNSHYNLILATDGASVLDVGLVYDVNIGGAKTEVVLGAKTEITVGAKTEVVIGADTDVVVGAKVEVQVGPKIEVHCETTMEDMAEVHCETSDVHVTDTNLTLETEMTKIEERLLKLEETSTEIKSSDLTLHDSGLHMYS